MEQLHTFLAAFLLATTLHANDIHISNPTLTGTNMVDATTQVQFNISWSNSWRTSSAPGNWDAAWVFVKYRNADTGLWQHARLGSDAQHSAPVGTTIATGLLTPGTAYGPATNWGVGAFIHRSAPGTGTFTANGVEIRWNYGQNGIAYEDIAEVKVFAVEMVYVPQGSFYLGSGGSENFRFKNGTTDNPFQITSEGALSMNNVDGQLWATGAIEAADLPAAFPKGFAGFYLMKYSITQQQYVDFLNTLTRNQQNTRTATNLAVGSTSVANRYVMHNSVVLQGRNGIRCDAIIDANAPIDFYCDLNGNGTGGEASDGQWIACNYLNWADVAAYLDWSGLRPMSELEYEKASRGPLTPVPNEYVWGNASIRTGNYSAANLGTMIEEVIDPETGTNGNALYFDTRFSPIGPCRVGLFARAGTDRVNAGASYYGAMELSGNLWERPITVANNPGRAFEGTMGDGVLDAIGNANVASWPSTVVVGAGIRGGSWLLAATFLRVSDRSVVAFSESARLNSSGGRGCRSMP